MIFFLIILLVLSCISIKFAGVGKFHEDYLSKSNTTAINGIFVVFVFFCHFAQYISFGNVLVDRPFVYFISRLGQLVVTTFFFFSGYGIICSITKKGMPYIKSIPYKRFLGVLIHFDIAVGLFMLANLCLGRKFPLQTNLLALTGWESIGNSNWYIFAILCLYLIVFLSFIVCKGNKYIGTAITAALTAGLVYLLMISGKPAYYYNTLVCYPLGMVYGLFKDKIDKFIMKNDFIYLGFLAVFITLFCLRGIVIKSYTLVCVFFLAIIVLASMKIRVNNKFLQFTGSHVFEIYILQRLPMMIFAYFGLTSHRYIFFILSIIVTFCLTLLFKKCTTAIDKKLFKK